MRKHVVALVGMLLLSTASATAQLPTPRAQWRAKLPEARLAWVDGMQIGYITGEFDARSKFSDEFDEKHLEAVDEITMMDQSKLVELIDHLYSDPANEYVDSEAAVKICVARFHGREAAEELLRTARKFGLAEHQRRQRINMRKPKSEKP